MSVNHPTRPCSMCVRIMYVCSMCVCWILESASLACRIRSVSVGGEVKTVAGSGTAGYKDGPGQGAMFSNPTVRPGVVRPGVVRCSAVRRARAMRCTAVCCYNCSRGGHEGTYSTTYRLLPTTYYSTTY